MRLTAKAIFVLFIAAAPATAIVTLGQSTQNYGLMGIGPNSQGEGQSTVTWGNCAFDGTNTNCTLSGPYTGLGSGGTYSFVLSYAGNGPFPLNAVSQSPGSDLIFFQATNNSSLVITLTPNSGQPLSFYSFANFSFFFTTGAVCTSLPPGVCSVGQVGLTPGATMIGPIIGSFDPTPMIRTDSGVITASGYGGFTSVAPSTWIEIYGVNLATTRSQTWAAADFKGNQAPAALGGTTVTVAGKPAYVYYVAPGQANVQVPSGVPSGFQPVVVTTGGGSSAAYNVNVVPAEPGLLAIPAFIINGKQNVVALFSNTLTFVLPVGVSGVATARAKPGDLITLYGIGFGLVNPDFPAGQVVQQLYPLQMDFKLTFGGVPASVTYAGLGPGNVGLYQFNVVVPSISPSDAVPVAFTLGGVPSTQSLVIAIGN